MGSSGKSTYTKQDLRSEVKLRYIINIMSDKTIFSTSNEPKKTSIFSMVSSVVTIALVMATLFTLWTPANLFSNQMLDNMFQAWRVDPTSIVPTPTRPPAARIGIVAGHWGNDPGAVCSDGLREVDVNLDIASRVQKRLVDEGYQVDLLKEFDEKLYEYQALALISIHNDSCDYINDQATGFKVAAAYSSAFPEKAERLRACMVDRYARTTNMGYHQNTVTQDMKEYHTFREINSNTTAAIIETGFLNLDRQILTERPDLIADGITAGILCYIRNESVP